MDLALANVAAELAVHLLRTFPASVFIHAVISVN